MNKASPVPGKSLPTPSDHTLILIDYQSQMVFALNGTDVNVLRTNVALIGKSAAGFKVSTIVTTVAAKSFSGPLIPEVTEALPDAVVYDRTSMNTWEDRQITDQVNAIDKQRLVICGLWTSVCIVGPVLSALDQGFEVYVIADACGDVSDDAHRFAIERMVQAGARPITSLQYLLELQRDWARTDTYALTTGIAGRHGGGYGIGIQYASHMFGAQEGH